jgi:serine/threonine protein kinase
MIVKDSFVGNNWNNRSFWNGPIHHRISHEAYLHRQVSTRHACVIELLGDYVDHTLRIMRLYTSYGEMGDLHTLLANHIMLHERVDEKGKPLGRVARLPAVVVICLCEAMAAAVCLMAHGQLPDDQGVWPGLHGHGDGDGDGDEPNHPWSHDIIHRDIKPANFFLTRNGDPKRWDKLPVASIGDFGNGLDLRDPWWIANPNECKGMGTPGWEAPEQEAFTDVPMTSAVNVFQVGLVMFNLMTLTSPEWGMRFNDPDPDRGQVDPDQRPFPSVRRHAYPQVLVSLAFDCTHYQPARRPSPKELFMRMRKLAQETDHEKINGASHLLPWGKLTWKLNLQQETLLTILVQNTNRSLRINSF